MTFPYTINPERSLVTITYEEPVTFERWRRTMEAVFAEPSYRPGFDFLGDRRGVRKAPSVSYVESIVEYVTAHGARLEGARWANVVPSGDRAMFGMGYMVDVMTGRSPITVKTFDDHAQALTWLRDRGTGVVG